MNQSLHKFRALVRVAGKAAARTRARAGRRTAIGVVGAFEDGNLGDLACLEAARRMFGQYRVVILGPTWDERRLARLGLSARQTVAAAVFGGGTIINYHRTPIARRLAADGVPLYTFGAGVGPCGAPESEEAALAGWPALANCFRICGVRGEESAQRLTAMGFRNVSVVGDLALGLTSSQPVQPPQPRRAGLVFAMPEFGVYGQGLYRQFPEIEKSIAVMRRGGWEIVPCFIEPKDEEPYRLLRENAGVELPPGHYSQSLRALLKRLATCSLVVTIRLHGSVLAATMGIPTVLISYGPKCDEFHRSIGRERFTRDLTTITSQWLLDAVAEAAADDGQRHSIWSKAAGYRDRQKSLAGEISRDIQQITVQRS